MIKHIVLASAMVLGTVAHAGEKLSDTQEGALYGVGGLLLFQHLWNQRDQGTYNPPPSQYPGGAQYPALDPVRDAYEQGLKERQAEELRQQQEWAYQCGRYGKHCDRVRQ